MNPPDPPAVSVTLSPQPPSSTDAGSTINLTAVVSNDTGKCRRQVDRYLRQLAVRQLFRRPRPRAGQRPKYSAPASAPNPATVAVTATSVTDSTKSASATIAISAPSPDHRHSRIVRLPRLRQLPAPL